MTDFEEWWEIESGWDGDGPLLSEGHLAKAAWDKATLIEREACAKECEDSNTFDDYDPGGGFAQLIRNRNNN